MIDKLPQYTARVIWRWIGSHAIAVIGRRPGPSTRSPMADPVCISSGERVALAAAGARVASVSAARFRLALELPS